jgi:hypothetical protein
MYAAQRILYQIDIHLKFSLTNRTPPSTGSPGLPLGQLSGKFTLGVWHPFSIGFIDLLALADPKLGMYLPYRCETCQSSIGRTCVAPPERPRLDSPGPAPLFQVTGMLLRRRMLLIVQR